MKNDTSEQQKQEFIPNEHGARRRPSECLCYRTAMSLVDDLE